MRALPLILLSLIACKDSDPSTDSEVPEATDNDGDGYSEEEDCDDGDPEINAGATELCDGVDNDCDGEIDDGAADASAWYADSDGDGYGDEGSVTEACEAPEGYVAAAGDCDDGDAAYNPDAAEDDCADPNDYNCDGSVGYADADGDGFAACEDCDDDDAALNPDAAEVCDDVDNDCDGLIDDDDGDRDASTGATFYQDADSDGYGDSDFSTEACEAPTGYVADSSDCDDSDGAVNPAASEICDDLDNDCDGLIDDNDDSVDAATGATYYADGDSDGYGLSTDSTQACDAPTGYVADSSDCDDGDASINSAASEACDGVDNDCDGTADDGLLGSGASCGAESCAAVLADNASATDGSYYLDPTGTGAGTLYTCDMSTDGGGWTQIFDWDRENDGDDRAEFESTFTVDYDNMGDNRSGTTYIEWSDYDATGDIQNAYHDVGVPNGGESLLNIHYSGASMEQSGIWLYVDADGIDEDIYCEDIDYDCVTGNYSGLYDATELSYMPSYTCSAVASGNISLNGSYQSTHTGEVQRFAFLSMHCDAGRGDYSRLYSIDFWVR